MQNGERVWKWLSRLAGVTGVFVLLLRDGIAAGVQYYLIFLAFIFGPDILTGKIKLKVESDKEPETEP